MDEDLRLVPVGFVRSGLTDAAEAPRQGRDAGIEAEIEVLPAYLAALEGLAAWSQVVVVCWLHRARRDLLRVHPRRDPGQPLTGVFATRSPNRPNPLAVYTVELLAMDGGTLTVRGMDAVDGTPVVDLRPHIHRLDD